MFKSVKARAAFFMAAVSVMALGVSGVAGATGEGPEYSKLTSGITSELEAALPTVLTALGVLIGITFAIKWAMKRFGGAK